MEPSKTPLRVGVTGTCLWLGLFLSYAVFGLKGSLLQLAPNNLGDFLAGAFAPLAFLWLVVGYLQQSNELRLQVRELSEQVKATNKLAEAAHAETKLAEAEGQPRFELCSRALPDGQLDVQVRNHGESARSVRLGQVAGAKAARFDVPFFAAGGLQNFRVHDHGNSNAVQLVYHDIYGVRRSVLFFFDGDGNFKQALDDPMA